MSFVIPPDAVSWIDVAPDSDFPIQNIPFGQAYIRGRGEVLVAAIGDQALVLPALLSAGMLDFEEYPALNGFYDIDRAALYSLRERLYEILHKKNSELRDNKSLRKRALVPIDSLRLQTPIPPASFVDFYSGIHHASNVGQMFRPTMDPLLPNYRHLPVAYNGRANTVVPDGVNIVRPKGQILPPDAETPIYAPCKGLDFELEMGVYVAEGQDMGKRITCKAAESHMLGMVICNDWSARDIQKWEYQPLGPFLAKSIRDISQPLDRHDGRPRSFQSGRHGAGPRRPPPPPPPGSAALRHPPGSKPSI